MKKVLIMGAAGRDFHNFNTYFRDNPNFQVSAFTAAQIPENIPRPWPENCTPTEFPYSPRRS
jgi:predicted GTPase